MLSWSMVDFTFTFTMCYKCSDVPTCEVVLSGATSQVQAIADIRKGIQSKFLLCTRKSSAITT